jgi:hypothetical protein
MPAVRPSPGGDRRGTSPGSWKNDLFWAARFDKGAIEIRVLISHYHQTNYY